VQAFAQPCRASNLGLTASVVHWDLGAGESQVISQAIQTGAWTVLDDLAARRCAAAHQIPIVGSLGIIYEPSAKASLDLQLHGSRN
jgi:predicted nucleic acid-binding protein